jgi:hypothetical protein
MVVLLRGNPGGGLRRVHPGEHVLAGAIQLFDVVVDDDALLEHGPGERVAVLAKDHAPQTPWSGIVVRRRASR